MSDTRFHHEVASGIHYGRSLAVTLGTRADEQRKVICKKSDFSVDGEQARFMDNYGSVVAQPFESKSTISNLNSHNSEIIAIVEDLRKAGEAIKRHDRVFISKLNAKLYNAGSLIISSQKSVCVQSTVYRYILVCSI